MEKLRSVCIIQRIYQNVPAVYLKEFFMFAGVYVCEEIIDPDMINEIKNWEQKEANLYIDLTASENGYKEIDTSTVYLKLALEERVKLNTINGRAGFGKTVFLILWEQLHFCMQDENEIKGFRSLADIFVDTDYAHKHYLSHLYLNQMELEEKNILSEFYLDCFRKIYDEYNKNPYSLNLSFAYLNCTRKMNRIDASCNRQTLFDEIKVMENAHEMFEIDSSFTIADVLAGQIAFSRNSTWEEGKYYLQEALRQERTKKYSAFIYYCMGHFYEVEEKDLNIAEKLYSAIRFLNPGNYRMNFKLGWIQYCRSEYLEARHYFDKVYKQMKVKEDEGWILPLEMEYKYKCALILNKSEVLKNTLSAEKQSVSEGELLDIKNKIFNNSFFVSDFLDQEEIELYRKYFQKKIDEHKYNLILD